MALIKSMLDKLIAELKKAPPEVKGELKSALGEETVTAPEVKEEPENKVADPVQETEVKDEVKEEPETDGNGENSAEKEVATDETQTAEETTAEEETPENGENTEPEKETEEVTDEEETEEVETEAPETEEEPVMQKGVEADEGDDTGDGETEAIAETAPEETEEVEGDIPEMRNEPAVEESDMPADYEAIIDGLNAKILALQAENQKLKAKTEGAFGYSSKIGGAVKHNCLYDDCDGLKMHK